MRCDMDIIEYDRYGREFPDKRLFGRCRYKGGSKTTTSRNIPGQTAQEANLEKILLAYDQNLMNMTNGKYTPTNDGSILDRAYQSIQNVPVFDWKDLYNQYKTRQELGLSDYTKMGQNAVNTYGNASAQNLAAYENQKNNALYGYNRATNNALNQYNQTSANALAGYNQAAGKNNAAYQTSLKDALSRYDQSTAQALANYNATSNANNANYQRALANSSQMSADAANQFKAANANYLNQYNRDVSGISDAYKDLTNGILPAAYAQARQQALNSDLKGTMGNAVSNLATRGIMNSSITNKALSDISRNASDTLARNYTSDLSTQAGLLNQRQNSALTSYNTRLGAGNASYGADKDRINAYTTNAGNAFSAGKSTADSFYNAKTGLAQQRYGNATSTAGNAYNAGKATADSLYNAQNSQAQQRYGNMTDAAKSIYNAGSTTADNTYTAASKAADSNYTAANNYATNLFNNRNTESNNLFQNAAMSQINGYTPATTLLGYASQLASPAQNMYNTMYSGRMGTGSTSTSTSQSTNPWSVVGTLGSAAIMCFTGNTLVTTPNGYKKIKDIKAGDVVCTPDGDKRVTFVKEPHEMPIVHVTFSDGTRWHTTESQRYYDGTHFHSIFAKSYAINADGIRIMPINVDRDKDADAQLVYDFAVEGTNVFYANDVAAEGYGD